MRIPMALRPAIWPQLFLLLMLSAAVTGCTNFFDNTEEGFLACSVAGSAEARSTCDLEFFEQTARGRLHIRICETISGQDCSSENRSDFADGYLACAAYRFNQDCAETHLSADAGASNYDADEADTIYRCMVRGNDGAACTAFIACQRQGGRDCATVACVAHM